MLCMGSYFVLCMVSHFVLLIGCHFLLRMYRLLNEVEVEMR